MLLVATRIRCSTGKLPQYYISDCHEPIIDREIFAKVQEILKERAEAVPTYPFTGKIKCGVCGHPFTRKKGRVRGKTYIHWICRGKKEVGMTCSSVNFGEEELEAVSAHNTDFPRQRRRAAQGWWRCRHRQ